MLSCMPNTKITRIGVFAQGQILCISPNGLQAGHCDAPPPPTPFWMTENEFLGISRHFITSHHFRSHFSPFQTNTRLFFWILFIKWLLAAILVDRNHFRSHFSPFQINAQLLFCSRNFWSHFSPFQINTELLFLFAKWLPAVTVATGFMTVAVDLTALVAWPSVLRVCVSNVEARIPYSSLNFSSNGQVLRSFPVLLSIYEVTVAKIINLLRL